MERLAEFFTAAREREHARLRRARGEPRPWTTDQVFQAWRFCNVRREDDKTTVWFRDQVRAHLTGAKVVDATVAFRWFNRIETGERVKDLLLNGWNGAEARRRLEGVEPLVTGAYIIKTPNGKNKLDGVLWCIDRARGPLWAKQHQWGTSLREAWLDLREMPYLGSFMAYEIVSDLRWTDVLRNATDINSWAAAGPGCARGLGWVVSGAPNVYNYHSEQGQKEMLRVMRIILDASRDEQHWPASWEAWEMREVEHWACEFDKYQRVANGGTLKRRFS